MGWRPVLGYLRRLGVAPAHAAAVPDTPVEILLAEYRRHLVGERGLSAGTVTHYLRCAGNGEVARLQLADVDWRSGDADVGEALADYLYARPATSSRCLFVTLVAPFTAIATSSVTVMVARACARAGVARFGPHGMRHAAACDLLAAGASMEEIGQLLRHAQARTTAIYAKVDRARLAELALPCPWGAAR